MDVYLGWLLDLSPWHWFALMVVLIGIEVSATTAYLLFAAVSALVTGIVLMVWPDFDLRLQMLVFAAVTFVTTVIGRNRFRNWATGGPAEVPLNARAQSLTGKRLTLEHDLTGGQGRVHIGDSWWLAATETGEALPAGTIVEVTGIESTTLTVRRVDAG